MPFNLRIAQTMLERSDITFEPAMIESGLSTALFLGLFPAVISTLILYDMK
jgi:hypothetical protein